MIRRVAITDHDPDEGPGSVCIRCGVAKAWHATPLERLAVPRALPACRRCGHDEDRHHKGIEPGWQNRCDLIGCACIAYRAPSWWHRLLDLMRRIV
jgi:ribosomal protein L40E